MSQLGQYEKKIVSKSKYVQVQSLRLGVGLAGFGLMFAALAILMLTVVLVLMLFVALGMCLVSMQWEQYGLFLLNIIATLLAGAGTLKLWKMGQAALDRTDTMNNVVPLTRMTTLQLPAPESLVRASAEPPTAPETVLLRAAADNATTPPEQLVRSSTVPE